MKNSGVGNVHFTFLCVNFIRVGSRFSVEYGLYKISYIVLRDLKIWFAKMIPLLMTYCSIPHVLIPLSQKKTEKTLKMISEKNDNKMYVRSL